MDQTAHTATSERDRRLAASILTGRSSLDDEMLRTIRANALAGVRVPPPRVLQLLDELDRVRDIANRNSARLADNVAELSAVRSDLRANVETTAERLAAMDVIGGGRERWSYQEQARYLVTGDPYGGK